MAGRFTSLAIPGATGLMFGRSTTTVRCGLGLELGKGEVYPELNFTLPTMALDESTWSAVLGHYEEIGASVERAARRLHLPGLMIEFELLPPMTEHPSWGAEITAILNRHLKQAHEEFGLPCALRVTPTDIRDVTRPPDLRSGKPVEALFESFEQCAAAGAHVLSIESVGAKEVHDEALLYGDIEGVIFALGVLAPRDMEFLWKRIISICKAHNVVAGGDSACGFANTAMQLSSQGMLPEVLATIVRAASSVRSLVAYECGAQGPSKDCAYEGPVIKAITGTPIAMEGKSASCAHFSPVGNVAAAMCDLWSNESVQNLRLLSGPAPEAYLELLAYDCRLFNRALRTGTEGVYQKLLVDSDIHISPQAYILSPESTSRIAAVIVKESNHYAMTLAAAKEAVAIIRDGAAKKALTLNSKEVEWTDRISRELDAMPADEQSLMGSMQDRYGHLFSGASYGL
ncbi:MAG TPA: methyltransferase MtaB domain-containing protein [Bacteroidota bacterium]|nr:methyltransferase MtaB domain-containing protein [Bacteroidota bacterium]